MSLPPEKVHIKRKKEDDPVEALLFATQDGQRSANKRQLTNEKFIFRRQKTDDAIPLQKQIVSASSPGAKAVKPNEVPTIRTTKPGEEHLDHGGDTLIEQLFAQGSSQRILHPLPVRTREFPDSTTPFTATQRQELQMRSSSTASTPALPSTLLQPRRFHLSKSTPTTPFPQSPVSGVHKRRKGAMKNEVAVFVEKEKRKLKKPRSLLNLVSAASKLKLEDIPQPRKATESADTTMTTTEEVPKPTRHRRPRVSALEKQLAVEQKAAWTASHQQDATKPHGTAQTIKANPQEWDLSSEKLTAELDAFVRETLNLDPDSASPSPSTPLRYKPCRPAHRISSRDTSQQQQQVNTGHTHMGSSSDSDTDDDDGEYVIDTYIREPLPTDASTTSGTLPKPEEVGYLVIEQSDEERWLAYAEKEDSEKEYDTDDQDSNAEDYYGNDYPEDEIDSDDEHGRSAYTKYRTRNASDEESFDDTKAWSDEDDEDDEGRSHAGGEEDGDREEGDWDWITHSRGGKARATTGAGGVMTLRDEDEEMALD